MSFLQVFKDLNQEYDLIELDQVPDGSAIQDELGKMTGARTVIELKNIFFRRNFICFTILIMDIILAGASSICQWSMHWRWNRYSEVS